MTEKSKELSKTYEPQPVEAQWGPAWEKAQLYTAPKDSQGREAFCVVIPPPNVTGSLHMGHALNNTLQDILVRYHRMEGKATRWVFGMDHAGIATQNVVERQLQAEKKTRHDLGRETFIERIWQWKKESGGTIRNQLKKLGASLDYANERFTMDEGLSEAVKKVFVQLYEEGLIYRDKRLVNWDCKLHTAISDLEVESREQKGHLWHFKYPLTENPKQFITVATTRPETMLGDTAVAVHPSDKRYQKLIGKEITLPLVGRKIPIIADEYSDPEKGSGAVKITPAHDFNDFEVGRRHQLEMINILDEKGYLNEEVPEKFHGMERMQARQAVVEAMEELGLLEKIEEQKHAVPYGDRSGTIIEPRLTDQWYVDAAKLAGPAIEAVEKGEVKFIPHSWQNTYFEWMRNIQPWCISRQIWWGHQIPAWYGPDQKIFVALNEEEAQKAAEKHYGQETPLTRDPDVLDTWFSSALWPFSTLGWPEKTQELQHYYPTSVLVTAFDIIFFWVARMMMMGLHFMKEVPFKDIYIHALVRDAQGQKMSKSKGNIIDPLSLMDKHGTDALRFTLAAFAAQGRDIKLSEERILGYRNFCNKIWNAARLVFSTALPYANPEKLKKAESSFDKLPCRHDLSQWILFKLSECVYQFRLALEEYRFNEAAMGAYHFFWGTFCDWYLELTKDTLKNPNDSLREEFATVTVYVLDQVLKLLHPIIPFITEELWQNMHDRKGQFLTQASFPRPLEEKHFSAFHAAQSRMEAMRAVVEKIRQIRMETGVPLNQKLTRVSVYSSNTAWLEEIDTVLGYGLNLAGVTQIALNDPALREEKGVALGVTTFEDLVVIVDLKGVVDLEKEKLRQEKELKKLENGLNATQKTLDNPNFVKNAPNELVEEKRKSLNEYQNKIREVKEALALL